MNMYSTSLYTNKVYKAEVVRKWMKTVFVSQTDGRRVKSAINIVAVLLY